ncbi:3378_t:CDS:2, partial [Acaulospora colombiana]
KAADLATIIDYIRFKEDILSVHTTGNAPDVAHSRAGESADSKFPMPSDMDTTGLILLEENDLRFPHFTNEDAYTLGQHMRKRFKASNRYAKGNGVAIAIKSVAGHVLYACTVGDSGDVTLESWNCIDGMIATVVKTGHSSYYIEKKLADHGRRPEQLGYRMMRSITSPEL